MADVSEGVPFLAALYHGVKPETAAELPPEAGGHQALELGTENVWFSPRVKVHWYPKR